MRHRKQLSDSGLAAGQMLLLLCIVGFFAGGLVFAIRQKRNETTSKHSVTVPAEAQIKTDGTTTTSEKIDSLELSAEEKLSSARDDKYQSAAQSAQDDISALGGAYNDDSL
jgi:hypothetical protein